MRENLPLWPRRVSDAEQGYSELEHQLWVLGVWTDRVLMEHDPLPLWKSTLRSGS